MTNKCFMNSNIYKHNNIFSKNYIHLLIINLTVTVWLCGKMDRTWDSIYA